MNAHTHQSHIRTMRLKKKVFRKRKVFKEDLKELTEVEWWTETGSWSQITGAGKETTGLWLEGWYSEHSGVCRRAELPEGSVKVKKF